MKLSLAFFRILSAFTLFSTSLGVLSPFIHPKVSIIPSFFGMAFSYVLVLLIILSILAMFVDKKMLVALLPCLIVSSIFVPNVYALGQENSKAGEIKVLSMNIRGGRTVADQSKEDQIQEIITFKNLISQDVDILCLQEMSYRVSKWLTDDSIFNYTLRESKKGTFIASKFKIVSSGEIDFNTNVNSCLWADLETDIGLVRLYNIHFQSNKIYDDTERALEQGKEYNPNVFSSLKLIFHKYRKYSKMRISQAEKVKLHMSSSPHPIILSGDFNETSMSYLYHHMAKDLNDAFAIGEGFGNTFPLSNPIMRIDYILSSKNLVCHKFELLRNISLSDHVPILTEIGIKN